MNQDKSNNRATSKIRRRLLPTLLIAAAIVGVLSIFFIKNEAIKSGCMMISAVSLGLNSTYEYLDYKKKSTLFLAVMLYVLALMEAVFCIGAAIGIH